MDQERIGILMSKLVAGEATLAEQKELEMALREYPSLRETWNVLKALKTLPPGDSSTEDEQKMLERGLKRLEFTRQERPVLSVADREPAVADSLSEEPAMVPWGLEDVSVPGRQQVIRIRRRIMAAA